MTVAGLISEDVRKPPVTVDYTWYDRSQGIVQWNFENRSSTTKSFILIRGVSQNGKVSEIYAFGDAFYPLYYHNFNVDFVKHPESLKNVNVKTNSAPLAVIENSDSELLVAFLYTLSGGESYSMLEGGWKGVEPGGISIAIAKFNGIKNFKIDYEKKQCTLYNEESNTDYKCPPDPFTVRSGIFSVDSSIKELFNDHITSSENDTCQEKLQNAMKTGNFNEYYSAIECLLGDYSENFR